MEGQGWNLIWVLQQSAQLSRNLEHDKIPPHERNFVQQIKFNKIRTEIGTPISVSGDFSKLAHALVKWTQKLTIDTYSSSRNFGYLDTVTKG